MRDFDAVAWDVHVFGETVNLIHAGKGRAITTGNTLEDRISDACLLAQAPAMYAVIKWFLANPPGLVIDTGVVQAMREIDAAVRESVVQRHGTARL